MKAWFALALVALSIAAYAAASPFDRSVALLHTLMQGTSAWFERVRRVPALSWNSPSRRSLAQGGGRVAVHPAHVAVLERYPLPSVSPVTGVAENGGGLFVGTFDDGLYRLGAPGAPAERISGVDDRVNDLAASSDGVLYVATNGGAFRVPKGRPPERLAPGVFTATALWRGDAYFASRQGLSRVEAHGLWTRGPAQGLGADQPALLAACGELLCIGAVNGLWLFDGTAATRVSSASGALPTDWVVGAAFGQDILWAATFDGGWARRDAAGWRRFAPDDGLPEGRTQPHGLALVGERMVAATPTGVFAFRGEGVERLDIEQKPSVLTASAEGGFWLAGTQSLERLAFAEGS